ncbi:MAG: sugar ABC transporter permease [Spirochaetia bacterium]|nr:sugar ABC transporter permease [Spirochaetia bacterium]
MKHIGNAKAQRIYIWFLLPGLVYVLLFVVYPIVFNVQLSFQNVTALNIRAPRKPYIGLDNYVQVFTDPELPGILLNTLAFTIGSIAFQFAIGFAIALFLQKQFPLRDLFRSLIMIGWVLSPIVVGTIWRWMLNSDFGLLNFILQWIGVIDTNISWLPQPKTAMTGVVMANIWLGVPFNMMLLTGGLANLPESVYESATIDGANRFQQFFKITIPLIRQTIAATIMLGFIYTLKVFDLIWVMTNGGPVNATTTMPVWSYRASFVLFKFSQGATISNVLFAMTLVLAIVYIYFFGNKED